MKAPIFKSAVLIAVASLLFSCQKDVAELSADTSLLDKAKVENTKHAHEFRGRLAGEAYIMPLNEYWTELYYYGTAEGWSNGLGKFESIFNTKIPGYFASVTDSPLFYEFLEEHEGEKGFEWITSPILEDVSVISYDKQGNSIWGHILYGEEVNKDGIVTNRSFYEIKGGSGKYEGATGTYELKGSYVFPELPATPYDLSFELYGTIYVKGKPNE